MSKKRPPVKNPRARTARREADREVVKLARDVQLGSASEVETTALARPCPICASSLRLEGHEAIDDPSWGRLRVARLVCPGCRAKWSRWFRLGPPLAN